MPVEMSTYEYRKHSRRWFEGCQLNKAHDAKRKVSASAHVVQNLKIHSVIEHANTMLTGFNAVNCTVCNLQGAYTPSIP